MIKSVLMLTSKLARQYQQKTCLHRLHIIWAQPSSFSIGTAHIGQHLIRSLSNGMPISSWPSAIKRRLFSSQVILGCHYVRNKSIKCNVIIFKAIVGLSYRFLACRTKFILTWRTFHCTQNYTICIGSYCSGWCWDGCRCWCLIIISTAHQADCFTTSSWTPCSRFI